VAKRNKKNCPSIITPGNGSTKRQRAGVEKYSTAQIYLRLESLQGDLSGNGNRTTVPIYYIPYCIMPCPVCTLFHTLPCLYKSKHIN
jgi:hypothetical protein